MIQTILFVSVHSFLLLLSVNAASIVDQSQSGDLNVHVNLKDIRIIGLMKSAKEEYVDYDYAYDYSEMTIKPQNSTTLKPLNVNVSTTDVSNDNVTETTTPLMETTSSANNISLILPLNNSTTNIPPASTVIFESVSSTASDPSFNVKSTPPSPISALNGTECKKGFSKNNKGECELKLQSSSTNALLKLVKLSQKLKLRREN